MIDQLRGKGAGHIHVFGGGGGVILPEEIEELQAYGVTRLYSPHDGLRLGLAGMIQDMIDRTQVRVVEPGAVNDLNPEYVIARAISLIEQRKQSPCSGEKTRYIPVVGVTGTGGAGKSSLLDELIRRFRNDRGDLLRNAVLAVDPGRRKTGGALLGDRMRLNALHPRPDGSHPIYVRSIALHENGGEVPHFLPEVVQACKAVGFDLIFVDTVGTGQHDSYIAAIADLTLYVITPEYGASSQLEKIDRCRRNQ